MDIQTQPPFCFEMNYYDPPGRDVEVSSVLRIEGGGQDEENESDEAEVEKKGFPSCGPRESQSAAAEGQGVGLQCRAEPITGCVGVW